MDQSNRLSRSLLVAVEIVRKYIDLHPLEKKSIDYFCDLTGVNRKLLQKAFKKQYGQTITKYQLQKRIEVAAELLLQARLSKKQISGKCGYQDESSFVRAFRKVYKQPPTDWQNGYSAPVD